MSETGRPAEIGYVDFNLKIMSPQEALSYQMAFGVTDELLKQLSDHRQYFLATAQFYPSGVSWLNPDQPKRFQEIFEKPEYIDTLKRSDFLIGSGSGESAYKYAQGSPRIREGFKQAQEVALDHLYQGKWALGVCFSGQLWAHAVGAELGRLPDGVTEAGWLEHELTKAGRIDPVTRNLLDKFGAPHFHNDYIAKLPPPGYVVKTSHGELIVESADVLAVRHGYLGKNGLENQDAEYIMASVIKFINGARLYQIQPHPEMATPQKANFLVRQNKWLADEMGKDYYDQALQIPTDADFSVSHVITNFVSEAKKNLELRQGITFIDAMVAQNIFQYLLK